MKKLVFLLLFVSVSFSGIPQILTKPFSHVTNYSLGYPFYQDGEKLSKLQKRDIIQQSPELRLAQKNVRTRNVFACLLAGGVSLKSIALNH